MPADRASDCVARLQRLEDVDVGAGDERVPGADQHHRVDVGIAVRARDGLVDALPTRPAPSALTGGLSIVRTATRS